MPQNQDKPQVVTVKEPKKVYKAPTLVEYGPIGDHTFATPGGTHRRARRPFISPR